MCGISCSIVVGQQEVVPFTWNNALLDRRGPDEHNAVNLKFITANDVQHITVTTSLRSSLLQLRGSKSSSTPTIDSEGNVLCFNGEIYGGLDIPPGTSDTAAFMKAFVKSVDIDLQEHQQNGSEATHTVQHYESFDAQNKRMQPRLNSQLAHSFSSEIHMSEEFFKCEQKSMPSDVTSERQQLEIHEVQGSEIVDARLRPETHLTHLMSHMDGSFSFVFYHASSNQIFFGRDKLGRRSLLTEWSPDKSRVIVTSTGRSHTSQVPNMLNLQNISFSRETCEQCNTTVTRGNAGSGHSDHDVSCKSRPSGCQDVPPGLYRLEVIPLKRDSEDRLHGMEAFLRVEPLTPTHDWVIAQRALMQHRPESLTDPGGVTIQAMKTEHGGDPIPPQPKQDPEAHFVRMVLDALQSAVRKRCLAIDHHCTAPSTWYEKCDTCLQKSQDEALPLRLDPPARILIPFSGGVDSTIIAMLAHNSVPLSEPIDLVNVCFSEGTSPDRLAALDALQEVSTLCPARTWRLILVTSSLAQVDEIYEHLMDLLHPACTVMDANIGAALWLAVRACGHLHNPGNSSHSSHKQQYVPKLCLSLVPGLSCLFIPSVQSSDILCIQLNSEVLKLMDSLIKSHYQEQRILKLYKLL